MATKFGSQKMTIYYSGTLKMIADSKPSEVNFVLPQDWKKPKFKITQEVDSGVITGMTYIKHRTLSGCLQDEWQYEVTYNDGSLPEWYSEKELIRMARESYPKQA